MQDMLTNGTPVGDWVFDQQVFEVRDLYPGLEIYITAAATDGSNTIQYGMIKALTPPDVPIATATSLAFEDTDPNPGEVSGTIKIGKAADESNLAHYAVYWGFAKTVVLVGDSIRMGYGRFVKDYLQIDTVLQFATVNQNPSSAILSGINEWILSLHPDIVVLNAGLHELDTDQATYQSNLSSIFSQIEGTGAKIVYVATTPLNETITGRGTFTNDNVKKVNRWAREVVDGFGDIVWDDLYAFVESAGQPQKQNDGIHYTDGFSPLIAREVASSIQRAAPERRPMQNAIATLAKRGTDLTYSFPAATQIPNGATHLMVFASNLQGEARIARSILLVDK
jgi:hypothetical protein